MRRSQATKAAAIVAKAVDPATPSEAVDGLVAQFKAAMNDFLPPCADCAHYTGERRCRAFPKAIPDVIWTGDHDHRTAVKGDGGVRFEVIREELRSDDGGSGGPH